MRKTLATILASTSMAGGLLISTRRIHKRLWIPQMLASEFAWIPAAMGVSAIAVRPLHPMSVIPSIVSIGMSSEVLLDIRRGIRLSEMAMRMGLGDNYEDEIPTSVLEKLRNKRLSFRRTLGIKTHEPAVNITHDVVFKETDERPLCVDIYRPNSLPLVGERYPAIIVVHGGSWSSGDKGRHFAEHHKHLAECGYVVFDIQYRFSNEASWPAQLEDVRDAIHWVKKHARHYQIDPDRIALFGRSSGGHIALHAAYRKCEDQADTSVAGIVAIYPPTELRQWWTAEGEVLIKLNGGHHAETPESYADTSVVEHVCDDLPATLLIQGYQDQIVPQSHVERLANALQTTNTQFVVLRIPWSRHGFDVFMSGLGSQLVQYDLDRFLAHTLYKNTEKQDLSLQRGQYESS